MSDERLEACPFCGGAGGVYVVSWGCVFCSACAAYGPLKGTLAEAIAAWNRRVPPVVPEPDWSQAPKEATHHLYDYDGLGWFVKSDSGRPIEVESDYGWDAHYLRQSGIILDFTPDWRATLTARPDTEAQP